MRLVLGAGFAAILEWHLEVATPADLLQWALGGMVGFDGELTIARRGAEVTLRHRGQAILSAALPPSTPRSGAAAGGEAADRLTLFHQAAWAVSAPLREAGAPRLLQASFDAVFARLDPFSRYVTPEEAQAARERRWGEAGLGMRLAPARQGPGMVIVALTPGGPAAEAGLHLGDRVLAVDGVMLRRRDPNAAAQLLEGPAGSEVVLLIERSSSRQEIRLRRTPPPEQPVSAERREEVLVIRIPTFSAHAERQVAAFLAAAFEQWAPRAVVLDLRGNRGGLLAQALGVVDLFLGPGLAFRTEGRHPDANRLYLTAGGDLAQGKPLVVVVDGSTASAAEVVAAALAEHRRAAIAGTVTMGKGLIQIVIPLPDGGELQLSWSRLVLPSGGTVQGVGVLPSLCLAGGSEAAASALAVLRSGLNPLAEAQARSRRLRPPLLPREVETLRSLCPAATISEGELALARSLALDAAAYATALGR